MPNQNFSTVIKLENLNDCFARIPESVLTLWRMSSNLWNSGVAALEVLKKNGDSRYIGSRGITSPGKNRDCLVLDFEFAERLGFADGEQVVVSALENVTSCKSVNVSPVSENDWEIIELNSRWLEDNLLKSISVVYTGLEFFGLVGESTRVFFKVDAIGSELSAQRAPCAVLKIDSEVIVKPRDRQKKFVQKPLQSAWLRVEPLADNAAVARVNPATVPDSVLAVSVNSVYDCYLESNAVPLMQDSCHTRTKQLGERILLPIERDLSCPKGSINLSREFCITQQIPFNTLALIDEFAQTADTDIPVDNRAKSGAKDSVPETNNTNTKDADFVETAMLTKAVHELDISTLNRPVNIMVCGSQWTGKTVFLRYLKCKLAQDQPRLHLWSLDGAELTKLPLNTLMKQLKYTTDWLALQQPSVLLIDNLDYWVPAVVSPEQGVSEFQIEAAANLVLHHLLQHQSRYCTSIVATSQSIDNVAECFRDYLFFSRIQQLPPLDRETRAAVFTSFLARPPSEQLLETSDKAWTLRDVVLVSKRILALGNEDDAVREYTPLAFQNEHHRNKTERTVRWNDIGGLAGAKAQLEEVLLYPTKYKALYDQCAIRLPSNVLIYGFPGTGKSLLALSIPHECHIEMFTIKGPELLGKYVGQSEAAVRKVFEDAKRARPCVLLFEEFESIAPRRGSDNSGVTDRVVNQLLTQLDGVEGCDGVYVLATSSRPDLIDPALLRPGRLDVHIYCEMPNADERLRILQVLNAKHNGCVSESELWETAQSTEGFTGADLAGLFVDASFLYPKQVTLTPTQLAPTSQSVDIHCAEGEWVLQPAASGDQSLTDTQRVDFACLREALKTARPSVRRDQYLKLKSVYESFSSSQALKEVDKKAILM